MSHMKAREIEAFHIASLVKGLMGAAGRRQVTAASPDELHRKIDALLMPLVQTLNTRASGKATNDTKEAYAYAGHELFRAVNQIWLLLRKP